MLRFFRIIVCTLTMFPGFYLCSAQHTNKHIEETKVSLPGEYKGYTVKQYKGFRYTSHYIVMRDSVMIAADIFLPKHLKAGKKVPTILYLTRYVRSIEAKPVFKLLKDPIFGEVQESEIKFFTSYGYACVIVDVRGTGASTGARRMEFSPEEIKDDKEIVDWIIARPWSDKQVGCTGVSYLGTTCEMLLANKHPNVKACIPRSDIFDLYNEVVFPGGVCQKPFVDIWGATTKALDNNDFRPFTNKSKLILGIHTVKGDKGRKIWRQALAMHKNNFDITKGLDKIACRDEKQEVVNASVDDFSISSRVKDIEASGTAIYRMDGWYDGALAKGCLDDWLNTKNTKKVLIGPWDHGPQSNVSPFAKSKKVDFDIKMEMLRFFDHYLKGINNGIDKEPILTYYTVGEEKWKTANTWPIHPDTRPYPGDNWTFPKKIYLSANNTLVETSIKIQSGSIKYKVDYSAGTGKTSRWNSLTELYMSGPTNYSDRRKEDEKLLCFTSDTCKQTVVMTGTPVAHLNFTADSSDASVFCYLEDVGPDSSVAYITEGTFRPMHRKLNNNMPYKTDYPNHSYMEADAEPYKAGEKVNLVFDLLPISYQMKTGHRLRVSIAGADVGHFRLPSPMPANFKITTTTQEASYIELPLVEQ